MSCTQGFAKYARAHKNDLQGFDVIIKGQIAVIIDPQTQALLAVAEPNKLSFQPATNDKDREFIRTNYRLWRTNYLKTKSK